MHVLSLWTLTNKRTWIKGLTITNNQTTDVNRWVWHNLKWCDFTSLHDLIGTTETYDYPGNFIMLPDWMIDGLADSCTFNKDPFIDGLNHWWKVTHIYVSKLTLIGALITCHMDGTSDYRYKYKNIVNANKLQRNIKQISYTFIQEIHVQYRVRKKPANCG